MGYRLDTRTLFRLHLVMQGIERHQADAGICKRPRLPISPDILMVSLHQLWLPLMQWAASCICFFGFLRAGEICTPANPRGFNPNIHLSPQDIELNYPTLCYSYLQTSQFAQASHDRCIGPLYLSGGSPLALPSNISGYCGTPVVSFQRRSAAQQASVRGSHSPRPPLNQFGHVPLRGT